MKTVLCYGDSITWGRNALDGSRFPFEQRWPGVLQARLGGDYRVIEEGLGGRTVATDSWVMPYRDGRAMLGPILESHAPLDWVIIMLGTADCAPTYRLNVGDIAFGITTMLWNIAKSAAGPRGAAPQILLVSPPHFGKLSPFMELFYRGAEETNRGLASAYATVAAACGAQFLDAAIVVPPSPSDGVHPDANGHRQLGETIAALVVK
jgi:lysophospholipase L1-like esterase